MTNTNKETRFANRKTLVKGMEITITETGEAIINKFEEYTPYVRSIDKAIKQIKEQRGVDNDPNTVITIQELVQDKPTRTIYDAGKLFETGVLYLNEEDAKAQFATMKNKTLVKSHVYQISGYVWYYDFIDCEYKTQFVIRTTPFNATKVDQRAIVKMELENQFKETPEMVETLATADVNKNKVECWYIVQNDKLEDCIKQDK